MRKLFNYTINSLKNSDFIQDIIKQNWKPYMVGGCVRDYIMGLKPHDIDIIVVGCEKDELIKILNKYGKSDLVGESFAVIKYYHKGEIYDIATPRTEKKIGVGHTGFEVISNKNITLEEDLFRRDITINSIAMDFDGNFIDPFGGINDIKNKIIKITNPEAFTDDPLRILRCIRFCARLGFTIDKGTSIKMNQIKNSIRELSQERIHEEWNKMLEHAQKANSSKMMQNYIDLLTEYDMWKQMFPGMIVDTTIEVESLNNAIIFYGLFNKDDIAGKKKMMVRDLKFTIDLVNQLDFLETYKISKLEDVYRLAKLKEKFHIDEQLIRDFVDEYGLNIKFMEAFLKYCNDGFIVDGNDLMAQGFKGKAIETEKERRELIRFKNEYIMM